MYKVCISFIVHEFPSVTFNCQVELQI